MGKSIKRSKAKKTQKLWNMKGCSKSKRTLGGKTRRVNRGGTKMGRKHVCHKCPPGCRCGPNCDCGHNCPGNCYLKNKKQNKKGGKHVCHECPPDCRCGPNCDCGHNCPGNCYLKNKKQKGGYCAMCGLQPAQLGGGCGCGLQMGGKHVCHKCPPGCRCGPNCDCGHNCPGNCYLKNKKQNGGCNTCFQGGGSANGALVGPPWTPKIADWPGVGGKDGQTNYFSMNKYQVDPQTETISERNQITYTPQNGGTRRSRAGGLIPQDLVNLGRSMVYGVGSAYNSLNGYATPVNPLPYKDQLVNTASSKSLGNF